MRRNSVSDADEFQCEKDPQCPHRENTGLVHQAVAVVSTRDSTLQFTRNSIAALA